VGEGPGSGATRDDGYCRNGGGGERSDAAGADHGETGSLALGFGQLFVAASRIFFPLELCEQLCEV
jgi:hypothetical protein